MLSLIIIYLLPITSTKHNWRHIHLNEFFWLHSSNEFALAKIRPKQSKIHSFVIGSPSTFDRLPFIFAFDSDLVKDIYVNKKN